MLKCRGILPPGKDEMDLINGVVGATTTHEIVVGQVFEISEESAGPPPYTWFEVLSSEDDQKDAAPLGAADGLTFASAAGQFRPDDELPV